MTLFDVLFSLSERRGREGVGCFCFLATEGRGQGLEVRDWVWLVLGSAWRSLKSAEPGGFGPRKLFDNFIGRKRDVDGGVLAGFLGQTRSPEETS